MKNILCSLVYLISFNAHSLVYQFEKRDDLGGVLISLGHKQLWSGEKAINKFKLRFKDKMLSSIQIGRLLNIDFAEIKFKKNVEIKGNIIQIKKKIKTLKEWEELYKNETTENVNFVLDSVDQPIPAQSIKQAEGAELDVFVGGGFFLSYDSELNLSTSTSTFSGLQPMFDLKMIYSNTLFGALASELMVKKIMNSGYQFPVNYDYRIQLLPSSFSIKDFNLAFSYSNIYHSYVGNGISKEMEFKLNSHFLGIGIVYPRESFWFELYLEKSFKGNTTSREQSLSVNQGTRVDAEVIYPIQKGWFIIPGVNYYQANNTNYKINVLEARFNFVREFEWSF